MSWRGLLLFCGFIYITVSAVCFSFNVMKDKHLFEGGKLVQAVIKQTEVTEKHGLKIQYAYQAEGKEYIGDRIYPDAQYDLKTALKFQKQFAKDTLISIYINPLNPMESLFCIGNQEPFFPYGLWIGILLLWGFWFSVYKLYVKE